MVTQISVIAGRLSHRYITLMLTERKIYIRFEVFTAVTMKNAVFWDIKPSSYFTGDTLLLHYRVQPVNAR
jgi:hypothetical protein